MLLLIVSLLLVVVLPPPQNSVVVSKPRPRMKRTPTLIFASPATVFEPLAR